jgi:hypothetical protein
MKKPISLFLFCFFPAFLFGCATSSLTLIPTEEKDFIATFNYQGDAPNISFQIQSKQDESILIIWDESAYTDIKGESKRIIHEGVRLMDRDKPQAPTVLPPKSRITGFIIPAENIYLDKEWKASPLFRAGDSGKCSIYWTYTLGDKKKAITYQFELKSTSTGERLSTDANKVRDFIGSTVGGKSQPVDHAPDDKAPTHPTP